MARVLVAMSGGVDSSVAAALMIEQGHDVTGVTLKLWGGEQDSGCCSASDVEDARRVAAQLGVPHYVFNFTEDFDADVVDPYIEAYANGTTPNPCVECNRTMKWGRLLKRSEQLGFDALVTGHHARIVDTSEGPRLGRGDDPNKDQSYVLYMLNDAQLRRTLLPVGHMTKADVRAIAARLDLRTATKSESMDVCFITKGGREAFLGARIPRAPGTIVTTDGAVVGAHVGIDSFTIGQRRGLNVAVGERRYVVDVDANTATVTIGERADLLRPVVRLRNIEFASGEAPSGESIKSLNAQVRAHGDAHVGRLVGDELVWMHPQPRVAPGQVVVFYSDDVVLGGGIAC